MIAVDSNFIEEIEHVTNPVKKYMLLQKYGLVPPQLTQYEQDLIDIEQQLMPGHLGDIQHATL